MSPSVNTNHSFPVAEFTINKKKFKTNDKGYLIGSASIELTSGYEASMAVFKIYNAYDKTKNEFTANELADYVELGGEVEIKLGYSNELTGVFYGYVASMSYGFGEEGLPCVTVTAMDIKGIMMASNYSMQLTSQSFGEAVSEIFNKSPYKNMKLRKKISDTPDKRTGQQKETRNTVEMVAESDYEFVVKAGKRFHYEFYTHNRIVYFRKAKSQDRVMKLSVGKEIMTFDITYSLSGLVDQVEVRAMDTDTGQLITSAAKRQGRLSPGNKANKLLNKSRKVYIDSTAVSVRQAEARAAYLMETASFRFGSLECECVGNPDLYPGRFVKIENLGDVVSNQFYIQQTIHTINNKGFTTKVYGITDRLLD